ncbi:MAG: 30S ribosomal protein S2 [Phycisphaerae bacterium]
MGELRKKGRCGLASELVRELIDAGVHFGHRASRWNPKMSPYIFGKRNHIHIVDIRETVKGLLRAKKLVSAVVAQGQDVLFVGTKRQARESVQRHSTRCGMHYVADRWLGGTLTNFRTIRSRLARLEELEGLDKGGMDEKYSKKMASTLTRELRKLQRNLEGIRRMTRIPGVLVIVDVKREYIAVREARKLGVPTICVVDTDSDPDAADIIIPGNDDAMRAIDIIVGQLADSAEEGKRARSAAATGDGQKDGESVGPQRRQRRMTTTAMAEAEAASDSPNDGELSEQPVAQG